jgi:hypothetical protein
MGDDRDRDQDHDNRETLDRVRARRQFHIDIAQLMALIMFESETALAVWSALAARNPTPHRLERRDECLASVKVMRKDYRDQLRRIANLGMSDYARRQKRKMIEAIAEVRQSAREALSFCLELTERGDPDADRRFVDVVSKGPRSDLDVRRN